jgi:hypothetical protein
VATHTLVTSAALTCVAYSQSPLVLLPADLAVVTQGVKGDPNIKNNHSTARAGLSGSFSFNGILFLPGGRGHIQLLPGDVLALDSTVGWPIVVSADAISNGSWTFT